MNPTTIVWLVEVCNHFEVMSWYKPRNSYQLSCLTRCLQVDLNLAQENAEKPDDYDERKKLWLDVGMSTRVNS